ncbi:MAG: aminopeptidase P family protein [Dehalococcoidales bacterium]|nr:aminopeptidase P family protein [Dehalococcoidales bacterium]
MSISRQEYERRYAEIRRRMEQEGIDCLLIAGLGDDFNRGNIRYVTGSGRGGTCVYPLEGKPVLLTGPGQSTSPKIPKTVEAFELLDLRETDNPAEQAVSELDRFYGGKNIGVIGMNCISAPMHLAVKEKFPNKLVDAVKIFEDLRSVKSAEEIEKLRAAAAVADDVYTMLQDLVKPGIRDYEIYGEVKRAIYAAGCEYSFDLIDASGSRLNMTFSPTGEKLKENNTLFMEITPAYDGYYAQLPVTLPVGKYPPEINKMVTVWEKANAAALEVLKPGTKVSDLYRVLVDTVKENGYISPLRPGHSIGLDALDFWSITESDNRILQPGMTLAVHPSIMTEMGGDACGMGYTYLITDTGAERFSRVELADNLNR